MNHIEERVQEARRVVQAVCNRKAVHLRRIKSAKEETQLIEAAAVLADHVGQCHAALIRLHERVAELEAERAALGEASMGLGPKRE